MKKLSDFATFKSSPYEMEGLEEKSIYSKPHVDIVSSVNTGEVFELRGVSASKTYIEDTLPYTKVYHNSLPKVKTFSNPALKVWCYILQHVKPNTFEVYLYLDDLMEYTGYAGKSNIYLGITELLDKEFISRSVGSENRYWINPNKLFNGRRVKNIK